jgi:N-acetylglucosaminyl-diphospho-decaprenol L-rhamnosyltransferase
MMQLLQQPNPVTTANEVESPRDDARTAWVQSITDDGAVAVSVCIANWNCIDYLRECLTSLQDFPQGTRVETIVVDNASTDGATGMVAREFPEVILIRNAVNAGFARASNQAADRARGRYVFFLNNDTVVPAETLGKLVEYADAHPEIGMLGPRLRDGTGRMQISYRKKPTMWAMLHRAAILRWTGLFKLSYRLYRRRSFQPTTVQNVEVLMGAAVLMRRELFEKCGRWDEDFRFGVEDVEFSFRVGKTHALVFHPGVEVIHHGRLSSRQNVAFSAPNHLIGYVHYFRKTGHSRLSIVAYKLLVSIDAPFQMLGRAAQAGFRRLRGKRQKAWKSWLAVKGLWFFLTRGMVQFWRA